MWCFGLFYSFNKNIRNVLESTAVEGDSPLEEILYGDF